MYVHCTYSYYAFFFSPFQFAFRIAFSVFVLHALSLTHIRFLLCIHSPSRVVKYTTNSYIAVIFARSYMYLANTRRNEFAPKLGGLLDNRAAVIEQCFVAYRTDIFNWKKSGSLFLDDFQRLFDKFCLVIRYFFGIIIT